MRAGREDRRRAGARAGTVAAVLTGEGRTPVPGRAGAARPGTAPQASPGAGPAAPGRAIRGDDARQRGSVLLETALAVPALVAVAMAGLWLVAVGVTQLRAGDAARMAARSAARGEPVAAVEAAARSAVPGSRVVVSQQSGVVTVTVTHDLTAPVPLLRGVSLTVTADATAALEESPEEVLP